MGNVSTPSRKTATPVIKAVTAVTAVAAVSAPSTTDKAPSPIENEASKPFWWYEPTIAALIANLTRGVDKIGLAHDAAEPGEPVEILLELISDTLADAIRPIWNEPLTKADTDKAYEAMFPPLAAIKGAIALAKDTVIEHTLCEAHAILDAAQTSIDSCAGLNAMLPDGTTRAEADFVRGRDLAVAMLEEADNLQMNEPDTTSPYRAYRDGKAQVRFTEAFLLQLIAGPGMLDGFNAVLSAKLGDQCHCPASYYAFSMAEYSGGAVGGDGTMSDPVTQEPVRTTPAPADRPTPATAVESDDPDAWRALAFDANFQIEKLAEGMKRLNEADGDEEWAWTSGILSRILTLTTIVYFAGRLYDGTAEDVGVPPLENLRRAFEGGRL